MTEPTVVVADDIEEMRQLLQTALRALGFNVLSAHANGQQAMEAIIEQRPNLCFLDIEMPFKTGLEILQEIRDANISTFPVIISGNGSLENIRSALSMGAKGFIVKPYSLDKLRQVTNKYNQLVGKKIA